MKILTFNKNWFFIKKEIFIFFDLTVIMKKNTAIVTFFIPNN
jgi:hypothetical protein